MKTRISKRLRRREGRRGSAVLIVLVMIFIMVAFVAANTDTLNFLRQRVKDVNRLQLQRLSNSQSATNQPLSNPK